MNIMFDFDGTILDSRARHKQLLKDILIDLNIDLNVKDLLDYKCDGYSTYTYLTEIKKLDCVKANTISLLWIKQIESPKYLQLDILYQDSKKILRSMSSVHSLFLVTARNNLIGTEEQIQNLNIGQYFKQIIIVPSNAQSSDNKYNKTKDLHLDMVIGDTEVDEKTAQCLKAQFIPINHGFRNSVFWLNKHLISINNLHELSQYIQY